MDQQELKEVGAMIKLRQQLDPDAPGAIVFKHDPYCDCGICQYCRGDEDKFGNLTKNGERETDALTDAAKGESVTVKAEPPDLKSILLEIVCNYPEAIEQIKAMENVTAAHYGLAYGVTPALFVSHGYDGVQDRVRLQEKPQQPDPATAESTATWKGVDADEFLDELRREDGDIEYIDQLESTDADNTMKCACLSWARTDGMGITAEGHHPYCDGTGEWEHRYIPSNPAQQPEQSDVCECGHSEMQHYQGCWHCHCKQFKPAQQPEQSETSDFRYPDRRCTPPEQSEVCERCNGTGRELVITHGQKILLPCEGGMHKAPPASELSRGAVITAIHLLPTEFDGIHTWIRKDIVINKLVQFAGQRDEVAALKIALADAIRCPMGVCPDSAVGLLTVEELKDAENRRIEGKSSAIKHIGLTGDQNER